MTKTKADENGWPDCGARHLKLAGMILGAVVVICGATIGHSTSTAKALEERVRIVEQAEAANAARFEAIQKALERLEARTP